MKTGLVLEGGAMRGMFTAGVLDVLMEHGITVDGAIGVLLFIFIALQRGLTVLWENRQSSPVTRVNIAQR